METKHILGLLVIMAAGGAGFFAMLVSQRMRDIALFFLVFGSVLIERMDITFAGQFWYRGTSRGVELSLLDVVPLGLLLVTMLLPRYRQGRFYWPASLGMMLLYFAYCCVSVGRAEPQYYGVWELAKMFRGVLVFLAAALFVRTRRELAIVVAALCCVACMEGANALEQRFVKGAFRPPGTFDHENTFSTYLCMIGPVLLATAMSNWSKWLRWLAGIACVMAAGAELMTLSRMGVPAFTVVMIGTALACTSWRLTVRKVILTGAAMVVAAGLMFVSWDGLKARYTQSNIQAEFFDQHAIETRGVYWRLAFAMIRDHPYGVGLNNWSYYVGKVYGHELGYPYTDYDEIKWIPTADDARQTFLPPAADTLPALTIGELGIAGLVVFLLVWFRWFQMGAVFLRGRLDPDPMHRLAIGILFGTAGIFMQSATEWTYRQTSVMFTCHVLLGTLASLYYTRRRARKEAKRLAEEPEVIDVTPLPLHAARVAK